MPIMRVVCPHCAHDLRTDKPVAAGQRAHCPRCGQAFRIGDVPPAGSPPPAATQSAIGRSSAWLWMGVLLGGVLLLMGVSAGLVIYFGNMPPNSGREQHAVSASTDGQTNADSQLPQETTPHQDPANSPWLSPERQAAVDAAIQRGVSFLKQKQLDSGTWSDEYHPAGLAALPALTLLECGVAADEDHINKALQYVRDAATHLDSTYEIALVLLFLERRNDQADRPLIHRLALRLVAGQTPAGGWSYECPILPAEQEDNLLTVLEALRPASHEDLFVKESAGAPVPEDPEPSGQRPEELDGKAKQAYAALPPALQRSPSLHPPSDSHQLPLADHSDNSNTQFAALALWAAGRQGLPIERALALTAARFRFSPSLGGGWDYHYAVPSHASTPSMTCAGLLGLALGHGLIVQHKSHATHSAKVDDAIIQRGMQALAGFLGESHDYADKKGRPSINLYYLWSLGRVGLLYRARTIGGKDWYAWGVNQVLAWQETDGSWKANVYPDAKAAPIINTCFALLFLQRSDLTEDVSKTLVFQLERKVRDENSK